MKVTWYTKFSYKGNVRKRYRYSDITSIHQPVPVKFLGREV